jgi:hypothetical protein
MKLALGFVELSQPQMGFAVRRKLGVLWRRVYVVAQVFFGGWEIVVRQDQGDSAVVAETSIRGAVCDGRSDGAAGETRVAAIDVLIGGFQIWFGALRA